MIDFSRRSKRRESRDEVEVDYNYIKDKGLRIEKLFKKKNLEKTRFVLGARRPTK